MSVSIEAVITKMQTLEQLPLVTRVTMTLTTSGNGFFTVLDPSYTDYRGEFDNLDKACEILDNLMDFYRSEVVG